MYRSVNTNSKKQANDRFIPRRLSVNFILDNSQNLPPFEPDHKKEDTEFINYAKVRHNFNSYQTALRSVLMPLDTRVLNFFSPKKFIPKRSARTDETWPVKPRKRPLIGPPDIVLDMPEFDSDIRHHVCDWSSNNCLATIFEGEIHMWYPDSEFLRASTNTKQRVRNCVKWTKEGTKFAVGLFPSRFGVWSIESKKLIYESFCCMSYCEICCFEWIDDDCLITGCSRGMLRMLTADLKRLKSVRLAHNSDIINATVSCNKKFLATSSLDKTMIVWKVPELDGLFQIKFSTVVRAMAWHPWKGSLLAIGLGFDEGRVVIWNASTQKQVASEIKTYKNSSVDCLTFNPISGELVVSYFIAEGRSRVKGCGLVAVLTNIDKVVEELHIHNGPVPYLLWGNGGKVLASVSADENLCIWDFFGHSENKKAKKQAKKWNENCLENFTQIRSSIR